MIGDSISEYAAVFYIQDDENTHRAIMKNDTIIN